MSDAPAAPPPHAVWTRGLTLACLLALITLGLAWELWLAPTGSGTLALKVLPLAFCVVGVLKYRMKTYRWLSLLVWVYVTEGAVRATSDRHGGVPYAIAEVLLCLLLFAACSAHIRWRLRSARPA